MELAIILTCHNRCKRTEKCIHSLIKSSQNMNSVNIKFYITEDNSTDGTLEMLQVLKGKNVDITIINGDGNLYWNRGMYKAFDIAMKEQNDAYLWVNDDVEFFENSFKVLLNDYNSKINSNDKFILVGSTMDKVTRNITYGGVVQSNKFNKLKYKVLEPNGKPILCDTMNGNCVLISAEAAYNIGNLDYRYEHGMGDYDYGLRAKKLGINVYIASDYVGYCSRNSIKNTWKDKGLSKKERLKKIRMPTGLPVKSWYIYTRKYGGILYFLWFIKPYIDILLS